MGLFDLNNPELQQGISLLAAGGPSAQPMSLGQRLQGFMQQQLEQKRLEEDRKARAEERKMQMQMHQQSLLDGVLRRQQMQAELDAGKRSTDRQSAIDALPAQFMRGPTDDPQGAAMPGEAGSFDTPGYANAMFRFDPKTALALQASMRKDTTPIKLAKGEKLLSNDGAFRELADNPADEKTPEALRAIEQVFGKGSPEYIQASRAYVQKLTTHAPPASTNVSLGSPIQVEGPNGPMIYQPANKPGAQGQIVTMPGTGAPARPYEKMGDTTRKAVAENSVALQKIDRAIQLVEGRPASFGGQNLLPEFANQRIDPNGVEARAAVADIGSQKLHDRSGAAVAASEAPRLMPFIPTATDTPQAAVIKLKGMKREYEAMQRELSSGGSLHEVAAARAGAPAAGWSIKPLGQ